MRYLTNEELISVQAFIDLYQSRLDALSLDLQVETDMAHWVSVMRQAPQIAAVNPSYDPARCRLTPYSAFWLNALSHGRTVACIANRLFVTDDFVGLMRTGRLWSDRPAADRLRPAGLVPLRGRSPFAGRIGHHGGLWVHPDWRGRRLAVLLPRLTRALSLRQFAVDWHCGLTLEALAGHAVPIKAYGYSRQELCIDGHFPVTGRNDRVYLTSISRAEMLAQMDDAVIAAALTPGERDSVATEVV